MAGQRDVFPILQSVQSFYVFPNRIPGLRVAYADAGGVCVYAPDWVCIWTPLSS